MHLRLVTSSFLAAGALGQSVCTSTVNIGFSPTAVQAIATSKAKSNWEWGTNSQALLELYDPDLSVYSDNAFPGGNIPDRKTTATIYAKGKIVTSGNTLTAKGVSAGDPASLGVFAIMLGQSDSSTYSQAATRQVNELLNNVPRYSNGAISHRYDATMLWSDFIYMVPPTLAYQAVATSDQDLLRTAINQIGLYRDILQDKSTGLWKHIAGSRTDAGTWSTGNGWTTNGITRVLATVKHWPTSTGWTAETQSLVQWAKEIIDGTISVGPDAGSGLFRNYITMSSSFPETAGTAALAASVYRLAVLAPETFATSNYIGAADAWRKAVVKTVSSNGQLAPVVNPYSYTQNTAYDGPSPEAQDFAVLLYTAYRDCICADRCIAN
ncbi:hypothetical protein J7T55_014627 [Diaporthe amygdali]|uniref:uncharacterized protein n=1 Tax=Phomopsis amygdali TaxID=1214568 RepID=UPI0022FE4584|nr:uncharacterized protein J7T55_014627 [Diaporthe amygdali]KAJ0107099.1 hypothetical protein J7T55_014627 [Diaporthe amygdali]